MTLNKDQFIELLKTGKITLTGFVAKNENGEITLAEGVEEKLSDPAFVSGLITQTGIVPAIESGEYFETVDDEYVDPDDPNTDGADDNDGDEGEDTKGDEPGPEEKGEEAPVEGTPAEDTTETIAAPLNTTGAGNPVAPAPAETKTTRKKTTTVEVAPAE